MPGTITSIEFDMGTYRNSSNEWAVYLGHTSNASFSSNTDWVPLADLTKVFDGDTGISYSLGGGPVTILLNTTFDYNNNDNLVIAVHEKTSGRAGNGTANFSAFLSGANTGLYLHQDANNTAINPNSPGTATGRTDTINQIKLEIKIADPTNVTATAVSTSQIDLAWLCNATPDNVMVAFNTTNTFGTPADGTSYSAGSSITGGGAVLYNGPATSFSHTSLNDNTTYYYKFWSVHSNAYSLGVTSSAKTLLNLPNPRFVAEWEQAQGAIVSYSGEFGLPTAMLKDISESGKLYVIRPSGNATACNNALLNAQVNMNNVVYITAALDTYWVRDYGPFTVMDGNNQMKIVDFNYNRVRPNDNRSNAVIADFFNLPCYVMPVTTAGGNTMTNGYDTAVSTDLIQTENPTLSETEIDNIFKTYLGVTKYVKTGDPIAHSPIDHIDLWAKLLDVDICLISQVPTTHNSYEAIEDVVTELEGRTSGYGTPYRIFRVDCQDGTNSTFPYINSYIFNKKIYVPQTGSALDAAALAVYQAAMPNYQIIGFTSGTADPWLSTDAIHCRVNTKHDEDLIHMNHQIPTEIYANSTVSISAVISSSFAVDSSPTYVSYRHYSNGAYTAWVDVPLSLASGSNTNGTWTADIPTPAAGDSLLYTIQATNTASPARICKARLNGTEDPFRFPVVKDDTLPVELSSFTVTLYAYNQVKLQWVTQSETNVSGFRIYRNAENLLETSQMLDLFIPATNSSQMKVYLATDKEIYEEGTYYYWLENVDLNGESDFHGPIHIDVSFSDGFTPGIPLVQGINKAYPNPFNPTVNISCGMEKGGQTTVQIYNTRGQLVKTLFTGNKGKGNFLLQWNGTDNYERKMPSGVYLIRMDSEHGRSLRKVVLTQ